MHINQLHSWKVDCRAAAQIQRQLKSKLKSKALPKSIRLVAGIDVSFSKWDPTLYAAVVLLSLPELELVESRTVKARATFPYVPGYLSFREIPVLSKAIIKLKNKPDVIVCDGHGIAHPRGFGLASHLGLITDLPSMGCAKTCLVGEFGTVGKRRWAKSELKFEQQTVGYVVRSRANVKPVFISAGHKINLSSCFELLKLCSTRYRLPEPTRLAHKLVNQYRKKCQAC